MITRGFRNQIKHLFWRVDFRIGMFYRNCEELRGLRIYFRLIQNRRKEVCFAKFYSFGVLIRLAGEVTAIDKFRQTFVDWK